MIFSLKISQLKTNKKIKLEKIVIIIYKMKMLQNKVNKIVGGKVNKLLIKKVNKILGGKVNKIFKIIQRFNAYKHNKVHQKYLKNPKKILIMYKFIKLTQKP